jgi:hypothetical protein
MKDWLLQAFYSALVQALKAARKQGHADRKTDAEESSF